MTRQTTSLGLLVACVLGLALFGLKYEVQDLEQRLNDLNRDIARDQEDIHVLKAEWSHLNDPRRLRGLAEKYLGMGPVQVDQIRRLDAIPLREEAAR